ncbi:hypothetical protein [Candidatus Amarolinea aalborgensis]|jgi:hypothetical protein|uniref:hypothetical protein n=1 Tax=Candidatus Amarolinea aalborgensis TaxID=2249329 RepID=UPI003BF9BA49
MSAEPQNSTPVTPSNNLPSAQNEDRPGGTDPLDARAERHEDPGGVSPWLGGAILIVLGLIFLAQNLHIATFQNWWAIFILIPAVGAFNTAWGRYQAAGARLTSDAAGSLIGGLVLTVVALAFLFNLGLNASLFWPVLLILGGVALLLQAVTR